MPSEAIAATLRVTQILDDLQVPYFIAEPSPNTKQGNYPMSKAQTNELLRRILPMIHRELLPLPLLYLSAYFHRHPETHVKEVIGQQRNQRYVVAQILDTLQ